MAEYTGPDNVYTRLGDLTVIPAADLADVDSPANAGGPARIGDAGIGKRPGLMALRYNGTDDYDLVIALGASPTAKWALYEMGTPVTPS